MKKNIFKKSMSLILIVSTLSLYHLCFAKPIDDNTLDYPVVSAESVLLMDGKTGDVLYEKNGYDKHYPASITKLMTALLSIEKLKPTDVITFSNDAINSMEWNSSRVGAYVGEQMTVDQVLHGLMLESGNDMANGLAEKISGSIEQFAAQMTLKAHDLGAKNTNFMNPHGLHNEQHYTTAYDMALITQALYTNEYFLQIMKTPTYQIPPTNKSTEIRYLSQQHKLMNKIRDSQMYREDVIGGKTGYTDDARHTLVTIARQGDIDLISVVLKSEKDTLYSDTNALLDFGFNHYQPLTLHQPGDILVSLPIYTVRSGKLYEAGTAQITVAESLSVITPKTIKSRDLQTQLDVPEYLELSAKEGQSIGSIDYLHNGKILASNTLLIQKVTFHPAPQKVTQPEKQDALFPFEINKIIIITGIVVLLIGIMIYKRPKKYKNKYKKLKFSRTLK